MSRLDIYIHDRRVRDSQTYSGMWGIEMKVKSGRESEMRAGLSRAEKKAAQNWSKISRQTALFASREEAERQARQYEQQYPHIEYRAVQL